MMIKGLCHGVIPRTLLVCLLAAVCLPARGARRDRSGTQIDSASVVASVRDAARPLRGGDGDYNALLELIGDAHFVLLGEATHGTHEFYRERARITRRLIEEKGFNTIVLEADFSETSRADAYVRGAGVDENAADALLRL